MTLGKLLKANAFSVGRQDELKSLRGPDVDQLKCRDARMHPGAHPEWSIRATRSWTSFRHAQSLPRRIRATNLRPPGTATGFLSPYWTAPPRPALARRGQGDSEFGARHKQAGRTATALVVCGHIIASCLVA